MPERTVLQIRQVATGNERHDIRLTLKRRGQPDLEAEANIEFALTPHEQEELRWYLEDYLDRAEAIPEVQVEQVEQFMRQRGEELYHKVLGDNQNTRAIWFAAREQLADLRIEIATGVAEAASIPWELIRDPQSNSPIALRVRSFVRVQSDPNTSFVPMPPSAEGRVRLLYVVCRPDGKNDIELRAVANRLLQDLGQDLARFDVTALRPPTFEKLQEELTDARTAGRPYHIVHFDGHGVYADLSQTTLAHWLKAIDALTPEGTRAGKHGYLLFEHPDGSERIRPVTGDELGKLLRDTGVPVLVLNACQSAMHQAESEPGQPHATSHVHDEVRAIGSLAQVVIDQGIPAVLGMRYSVFVVTAAQYVGQFYAALAKGRSFGEAASEGRKYLARNPDRWVGLQPRPLQDWFVPVVYEAMPLHLLPPKDDGAVLELGGRPERDPIHTNPALLRYVPDMGFVGRDETLLMIDRAFDGHAVVLLYAYAGQGKTATAVELARWYALTGGLGPRPVVLFTSFETHIDLTDVLNLIGQLFAPLLRTQAIEWYALNDNSRRRSLVLQILQQVPVLWIWDNVEPIAGFPSGTESAWTREEQAELAVFLKQIELDRATKAKILLTSRRDERAWLGDIPHRVAMPRMCPADAARMAVRFGDERQFDRGQIAHWQPLLDYCAGNPLTLRIIAAQAVRMHLRNKDEIAAFIQAMRDGEQHIQDADEAQGRDRSLGASLDYGFRNAFREDEVPIIALLYLFQSTVAIDALGLMGAVPHHALAELNGKTVNYLTDLLERGREAGLLTHVGGRYGIHPALPWFLRQLFARHYDGQSDRSTATAALRAWVEAIGVLGAVYHHELDEGDQGAIEFLALEEANLLHAHRTARLRGWWDGIVSAMQGLDALYSYRSRLSEWSRLVTEITPDYCAANDDPIPGREDQYPFVMNYRIRLARTSDRNLPKAAMLQRKLVALHRQQAALAIALPPDARLEDVQRNCIRSLSVSILTLGQILMDQRDPDCLAAYEEALSLDQRIGDSAGEAITHFNIGCAYQQIPAIGNLDAAEAAFQRSLALRNPSDAVRGSRSIREIGRVHHQRFRESLLRGEPAEALQHAQAAERQYLQALSLCPSTAITEFGPIHGQLGNLYSEWGRPELAREHFEKTAQYFEHTGNRYDAGKVRRNIALLYGRAAAQESSPTRQQDLLRRAVAYAQAALRDFQHYEGRAVEMEDSVRQLIAEMAQALNALEAL